MTSPDRGQRRRLRASQLAAAGVAVVLTTATACSSSSGRTPASTAASVQAARGSVSPAPATVRYPAGHSTQAGSTHPTSAQPTRQTASVSTAAASSSATHIKATPITTVRPSSAYPTTADPSTAIPTTTRPTAAPSTTSRPTAVPSTSAHPTPTTTGTSAAGGKHPVIVLDPGHSPTVHAVDPRSGIRVDEYENEPEMRDVFAVALLVRQKLTAAGYRVVITKKTARSKMNLAKRAWIANHAHAALALSIHDQAGPHGGIAFAHGNNVVYYQSVGSYRTTVTGKKVSFTDTHLAAVSKKYGAIFAKQRRTAEHHRIVLKKNVGYNLGSRGKPAGNMWTVQLLSKVPWIYNEAGGNSAGRSGLSEKDKHRYADGLVASIEKCVPIKH